jgi:hypothetical protein
MSDILLDEYLSHLQVNEEPPYLTEGIREFISKFDKNMLKKTVDQLHLALNKNDKNALKNVTRNLRGAKKVPKFKEVQQYSQRVKEESPEMEASAELSKKVIKNTFKIKDKAKLEIMGNAMASAAWVKSKGKRTEILSNTRILLQQVGNRVSSIYDTGIDDSDADDRALQVQMIQNAQKEQKLEQLVVLVILGVLVSVIVFAGVLIWSIITSKLVMFLAVTLVLAIAIGKVFSVSV